MHLYNKLSLSHSCMINRHFLHIYRRTILHICDEVERLIGKLIQICHDATEKVLEVTGIKKMFAKND